MLLGLAVFFSTRIELMLVVLFLMALHSTVFSPAKYGIVPEMLPRQGSLARQRAAGDEHVRGDRAGHVASARSCFTAWKDAPWKMGLAMLAVAVAGFLTSLRITRVRASGRARAVSNEIRSPK